MNIRLTSEQADFLCDICELLLILTGYEVVFFYRTDTEKVIFIKGIASATDKDFSLGHRLTEKSIATQAMKTGVPKSAIRYNLVEVFNAAIPIEDKGVIVGAFGLMIYTLPSVLLHTVDVLSSTAQRTMAAVEELTATAETLTEHSGKSMELINDIMMKVGETEEIAEFVGKLAGNTKLIGFNALIEAARAGSHGFTFKVVANEITSLAGDSAESLKQVKQELALIKKNVSVISSKVENFIGMVKDQESSTITVTNWMENVNKVVGHCSEKAKEIKIDYNFTT
ncbi:MAG: hypothetical protein JL50_04760 [Peptococcaceae bacterium BICA1-7]|nr:MAG: hypothetical protein JL50_04760 [Peptococcaceae bacterium BICA1-7]HBV95934.1 hypothetical protein [Desulfotomaculum sp.]